MTAADRHRQQAAALLGCVPDSSGTWCETHDEDGNPVWGECLHIPAVAAALADAERAVHDRYQALAAELEAEGRALKASGGRTAWLQGQKMRDAAARLRALTVTEGETE